MITMVSLSVLATVAVISISSKTDEPVPQWMRWLVLDKIAHMVCLHGDVQRLMKLSTLKSTDDATMHQNRMTSSCNHNDDSSQLNTSGFKVYSVNSVFDNDVNNGYAYSGNINGGSSGSGFHEPRPPPHPPSLSDEWNLIGRIVSRCFAFLFGTFFVFTTVTIIVYVYANSSTEFELAVGEHKDRWQADTYYDKRNE